ncbi:MAG TPA: hypothetical protein VEI03_09715 [Stellaceae bacterium]|nr:hypothetical protein [Stellaceae bacterium]
MRLLILITALLGLALPAFADCGINHQASTSDTVATDNPSPAPPADPASGG